MRRICTVALVAFLIPAEVTAAVSSAPGNDPSHSCLMIQGTRRMPDGAEASGTGTGFLVDRDLVLTCNHLLHIPTPHGVVEAQKIEVQIAPDKFVVAKVEQRDQATDLALLKLEQPVPAERSSLYVRPFSLSPKAPVQVLGNFPDQIRTSRGSLLMPYRTQGFGLASAKVYSGFSGGPVLDKDGAVHGILSQRDDNHNAIFTRSDAILDFLGYYARRNGRDIACFKAPGERLPSNLLEPAPEPIGDSVVASLKPATRTLPATKTAPKVAPPSEPEADEIVIALPVRPSAGTFVSSASSRPAIRE